MGERHRRRRRRDEDIRPDGGDVHSFRGESKTVGHDCARNVQLAERNGEKILRVGVRENEEDRELAKHAGGGMQLEAKN